MKSPITYMGALFEKGKRVHLIFCLGLLILVLGFLWAGHQFRYLAGALFAYGFCLGCIYTGRWICRQWLRRRRWLSLIGMITRALVIFDLATDTPVPGMKNYQAEYGIESHLYQ